MKLLFVFLYLLFNGLEDRKTLEIGKPAPDFELLGVDGQTYTLDSFREHKNLLLVFTCNHCPTAQAYEDRIISFQNKYEPRGIKVVAISPNADNAVRLDELGYSDLGDSFEEMKIRAKDKGFTFPYLYDGAEQKAANAYGPVATPHVFLFDENRILRYTGRIDNDEHVGRATTFDLEKAAEELLSGTEITTPITKTFGCSIKWAEKTAWKEKEAEDWKNETVSLEVADLTKLMEVVDNKESNKYLLINLWATWCGPCVAEFSGLVETDKMYRNRDFELVTISMDAPEVESKVLSFLEKKLASNTNYLFLGNKYELIDAMDTDWQGALPYTILIAPKGQIVYKQMGMINLLELRKAIVEKLGRYYP